MGVFVCSCVYGRGAFDNTRTPTTPLAGFVFDFCFAFDIVFITSPELRCILIHTILTLESTTFHQSQLSCTDPVAYPDLTLSAHNLL